MSATWERRLPACSCSRRDSGAPRALAAHVRTRPLPIQPQSRRAAAVVEGDVRAKILDIRLPGSSGDDGVQIHEVHLLRGIALDVMDDLLACLQLLRPALLFQHGRELGIIDMGGIPGGVGSKGAIQWGVRSPSDTEGTPHHALELALEGGRYIGPVFL